MNVLLAGDDLLLRLAGGVEVDVLMTACDDVGDRFVRERRAIRALARRSIGPSRSPEGEPEIWLGGELAWLALRVVCRFAEELDDLPPGIPRAVGERAVAMRAEIVSQGDTEAPV